MAELRWHPLTKDWVMINSARQGRPQMPKDWCPFCPGSGKVPDDYEDQFGNIEELADEAAEYMTEADALYHEAFEDFGCCCSVNILTRKECVYHILIFAKMSHYAKLNLRVVGRDNPVLGR